MTLWPITRMVYQFCAFSVPPPNNGAASFNSSENNLSHMGVTDGSTALILGEIQAMRTAIVGELGAKFSADIQKMHDDIVQGFSGRFQRIEDKVAKMEEEHAKFRQDLTNVSVTGSLHGDTLELVVNSSVEQALSNTEFVTKKPFEYEVTIACPGVRYSPNENVEEKAKQLIHEGLNLPNVKIVRAMRTPYNNYLNRPGLMKIELESVEVKKEVLGQAGRLRSWHVLGPKVIIRGSQTHEMRTQIGNTITFLKGAGLENQFTVNKNGVLQARPGTQAAANIQASNQMSQGNAYPNIPVYAPRSQSQPGPRFSYTNNPVYGQPPPSQPRPTNGNVTNSIYTPNVSLAQPPTYAQVAQPGTTNVNPLTQFMSGFS